MGVHLARRRILHKPPHEEVPDTRAGPQLVTWHMKCAVMALHPNPTDLPRFPGPPTHDHTIGYTITWSHGLVQGSSPIASLPPFRIQVMAWALWCVDFFDFLLLLLSLFEYETMERSRGSLEAFGTGNTKNGEGATGEPEERMVDCCRCRVHLQPSLTRALRRQMFRGRRNRPERAYNGWPGLRRRRMNPYCGDEWKRGRGTSGSTNAEWSPPSVRASLKERYHLKHAADALTKRRPHLWYSSWRTFRVYCAYFLGRAFPMWVVSLWGRLRSLHLYSSGTKYRSALLLADVFESVNIRPCYNVTWLTWIESSSRICGCIVTNDVVAQAVCVMLNESASSDVFWRRLFTSNGIVDTDVRAANVCCWHTPNMLPGSRLPCVLTIAEQLLLSLLLVWRSYCWIRSTMSWDMHVSVWHMTIALGWFLINSPTMSIRSSWIFPKTNNRIKAQQR